MDRKEARKIVNGSVNWRGARPRRGREGRGGAEISVYETDGRSKNDFQQSFEPHLLTRSRACYASLLFSGRSRFVSRETRSIFEYSDHGQAIALNFPSTGEKIFFRRRALPHRSETFEPESCFEQLTLDRAGSTR